jgi:hypothetical protein
LALLAAISVGICPSQSSDLPPVEPVSSLLYSPEEIFEVRKEVASNPVMKAAADEFLKRSERWMNMGEEQIAGLLPAPDAMYAAGYAGDPKTNGAWSRWGREGEVCSLDRPFEAKSPYTGDIYGIQKPGEPYYDDGKGWVRPEDGKKFYFKAYWNAYVIRALHEAIDWLSVSYMLTGDKRYADRALYLFDQLATLRAKRPPGLVETCIDFPVPVRPGAKYGFFTYDGNQGNDRMYASALAFDLVGKAASASKPSPTNPSLSTFENIRKNYFFVCERELVDKGGSLQNHATSAYASMIAQALLFGYPDDVLKGIEACYGFLDNTIDRDGEYYEISASYSTVCREYGGRMLSLFGHYKPDRYPDPKAFPNPDDFPGKLKFGNNPIWFATAVTSMYSLSTLSRRAQYGDSGADRYTPLPTATTKAFDAAAAPFYSPEARQKMTSLKLFYHQTDNSDWKGTCSRLYYQIPDAARSAGKNFINGILQYGPSQWTAPAEVSGSLPPELSEKQSVVTGHKRIAILRSGDGKNQRAIFIRGGSNAAHSHNDQMAVTYYADGMSLTGTPGYYLWGTPMHRGFVTRSVAHAMVVVDEDLPKAEFVALRPAARIEGYLPFGPAQFIEMSDPALWPQSHLAQYRRQSWLIDISDTECYFVDAFWVEGGKTHDYVWQAPFVDPPKDTDFSVTGISPRPFKGVWSLAGLDEKNREAIFNQPGKSWGERLETGTETMRPVGVKGERLPDNRWNPPPGNGYGFIWDIKGDRTDKDWSATWLLHDQTHFTKLTMLDSGRQTVITGKAPSLKKDRAFNPVIARRQCEDGTPLKSRFLTLVQASENKDSWPVKEAKSLAGAGPGNVGLVATHRDGTRDTLLATGPGNDNLDLPAARLHGKRAFIRKDPHGAISRLMLSEGTSLEAEGITLRLPAESWKGKVTKVSGNEIAVDSALPDNGALRWQAALFSSPADAWTPYASTEFFTVENVVKNPDGGSLLKFDRQSVIASRLKVAAADSPSGAVTTQWPNELSCQYPKEWTPNEPYQSRVFEGHLIRQENNPAKSTVVTGYIGADKLLVEDACAMEEGKYYNIMAVQPGDLLQIPSFAIMERLKEGEWTIRANMDVVLAFPGKPAEWILRNEGSRDVPLVPDNKYCLHIPVSLLKDGKGTLIRN